MDRHEAGDVPDRVPEDWVRRYGSRGSTKARTSSADAGAGDASLVQLVIWLVVITGVGAVAAWLLAGVSGIVAVVVPAVAIGGGGVLVLRWLLRTGPPA